MFAFKRFRRGCLLASCRVYIPCHAACLVWSGLVWSGDGNGWFCLVWLGLGYLLWSGLVWDSLAGLVWSGHGNEWDGWFCFCFCRVTHFFYFVFACGTTTTERDPGLFPCGGDSLLSLRTRLGTKRIIMPSCIADLDRRSREDRMITVAIATLVL